MKKDQAKKNTIIVTSKEQADQTFEEKKQKEALRLNYNYSYNCNEINKMLKVVIDKLHSEKMIREVEELKDLEKSIIEYINIIENTALTYPENSHYEGNDILVKRNKDFNEKAIKSFKNSLEVIKNRIENKKSKKKGLTGTEEKTIEEKIKDLFDLIDANEGWEYAFRNETDYNTFVNFLACYFDGKPYKLPQQSINLKRKCKTRVAKELRRIYDEMSNPKIKLTNDTTFFQIIRILNLFSNSTDFQIYKLMTG